MFNKIFLWIIFIIVSSFSLCRDNGVYENDTSDVPPDIQENDPVPEIKLESLKIAGYNLDPLFSSQIFEYNTRIYSEESEIKITAKPADGCCASLNDAELLPENYSVVVPVSYGVNEIPVYVYYKDVEGVVYTLRIYRMLEIPVTNSSFEIYDDRGYPLNWSMKGPGECRSVQNLYRTGSSAATFATLTSSISGRELISSPVKIIQGKGLELAAWFYLPYIEDSVPERVNISLKIYYYNDADCIVPAAVEYSTMSRTALSCQGGWEKILYNRDADEVPSDALFVRLAIRACYDSSNGGTRDSKVYFDDVSFQQ